MRLLILSACLAAAGVAHATWVAQDLGSKVQFRGISAVNRLVCWAAGSDGTYALTVDGLNWRSRQVPGAEKMVFRSVVAWDANHATLLAIGQRDASRIYHTDDGGAHWTLQFTNPDPNAFYDAIQFWDPSHGIALSDPVDGKFRILRTDDGGRNWKVVPDSGMSGVLNNEGAFAASGTCLVVYGKSDAWFATGGASGARVFHSSDRGNRWTVAKTPIPAGKVTAGIFGLAFRNAKEGVAVGGDYRDPEAGADTIAVTTDGGQSWALVAHSIEPTGLLECAGFADPQTLVVVGPTRAMHTSGLNSVAPQDYPLGLKWRLDRKEGITGLHTCSFVSGIDDEISQVGWAAGDNGLIAKWIWAP